MLKKDRGITLIALVITIIVLLILAGITIVSLSGENGILKRAQEARDKTKEATENEKIIIGEIENTMKDYLNDTDDVPDIPDEDLDDVYEDVSGDHELEMSKEDIYVTYYSDGTLAFDTTNALIPEKTKVEQYSIKGLKYSIYEDSFAENNIPWLVYKDQISTVDFLNPIKPSNTAGWFYKCANLTTINNIQNLDTSDVIFMRNMFTECANLNNLDISDLNTSNVKDMKAMFSGCTRLYSLTLGNIDTSNVVDMGYMFKDCGSLTVLDISGIRTDNLISSSYMFQGCASLQSLNLDNFNTDRLINMGSMFQNCNALTSVGTNFTTGRNTRYISLLFNNTSLQTIPENFKIGENVEETLSAF